MSKKNYFQKFERENDVNYLHFSDRTSIDTNSKNEATEALA